MQRIRSFLFPVPGLHGRWPMFETWLDFEEGEATAYARGCAERVSAFRALVGRVTGMSAEMLDVVDPSAADPAGFLAHLLLALQQAAGHAVEIARPLPPRDDAAMCLVVEFDHAETVMLAARLARRLVEAWLGGIEPQSEQAGQLAAAFADLCRQAARTAMPADARLLIKAAMCRNLPWYRMDREPFDPVEGDFRLRPNGLLRFGHGRHRLTLDGVFCVERLERWHGLVRDRAARLAWLSASGLAAVDAGSGVCMSAIRARRLAARLGGPAWVAPASDNGLIDTASGGDPDRIEAWAERILASHSELIVGRLPQGSRLDVLWIAGCIRGGRDGAGPIPLTNLPEAAAGVCERLAESLKAGCLAAALIESPAGWRLFDFDLNPRLDHYCAGPEAQQVAADALLRWMYPDGADGRIPIIAVTGTNGKTTTCHLVESILRAGGHRVGMATSLGSRVQGKSISDLEDGYLPGHLSVLGHPEVDIAVLESTRGGARSIGLGFDRCDAAACLNVAADHLNDELGMRTLQDLAEVKRWITLRASRTVVLNHDDPESRAMIDSVGKRSLTLVSLRRSAAWLAGEVPRADRFCTVERHEGDDWLTLSDHRGSRPILPVDRIPMALGGLADYNLGNAAHAAALCAALDIDEAVIADGLAGLQPGFGAMPGRLNLQRVRDFQVLFDYAHNPHGVEALFRLVDRLPVRGRRHLNFAVSGRRSNDFVREVAGLAAGRFDRYLCTNYAALHGRRPDEIPGILAGALVANGVDPAQIRTCEVGDEAIRQSLVQAGSGDLVVFLVGKSLRRQWPIIEAFGTVTSVARGEPGSASAPGENA